MIHQDTKANILSFLSQILLLKTSITCLNTELRLITAENTIITSVMG